MRRLARAAFLALAMLLVLVLGVSACSAIAGLGQFHEETCGTSCDGGGGGSSNDAAKLTVGGTVTGLKGKGLVLANGSQSLTIIASGPFAFPTATMSGATYSIKVSAQPSSPAQVCTVSKGTGAVGATSITSIAVTCLGGTSYAVGGGVSGLSGTLVLQDNGGDNLALTADGAFTFKTPVTSGDKYAVTVVTQPMDQTCTVAKGSGTVTTASINDVSVTCEVQTFTIGGTLSGLAMGDGLVLQDNAGDNLTLTENGTFTFSTPVADGGSYLVSVLSQPGTPAQSCQVTMGTGMVMGADVTGVLVSCATNTYTVGGTVFGLESSLVLQDNGGNNLSVTADGAFAFTTELASGATFAVTVLTQPMSPAQTCSVTGGTGTVGAGPVMSVVVNCAANTYTIGGTVSGLSGTLVLQNNAVNNLTLTANGSFAFSTPIPSGQPYAVTVSTNPGSPVQTCTVSMGSGTVTNANITSVSVSCSTTDFTVSAAVTNLAGPALVLQDNGGDNLPIPSSGTFTFSTPVASGKTYSVSVLPPGPTSPAQTCTVTGGSGTVTNGNVTVKVNCVINKYTVGGSVTGLPSGQSVVLQDNGGDNLTVSANGNFTFGSSVFSGSAYNVTVLTQPTSVTCGVTNGSGTVGGTSVTNVVVSCVSLYYPVGPQVNVPTSSVTGWTLCYQDLYDVEMSTTIAMIQADCNQANILMACAPVGSTTYELLAAGPTTAVFTDTGTTNTGNVTIANGVGWYFDPNFSWGFVLSGDVPDKDECDIGTTDPTLRLCWHTVPFGGYRCGSDIGLNDSTTFARYVFTAP